MYTRPTTVEPDFDGLSNLSMGDCTQLSARAIERYDETEISISFRSFRRHFTRAEYNALSQQFKYEISERAGLTLKQDWHISFGRGVLNGEQVICMHHSSIHYFYKYSPCEK